MRTPETPNHKKVSGTFNRCSGYHKVSVTGVRKDHPSVRRRADAEELRVDIKLRRRQANAAGKFRTQTKTFRINRSVYRKLFQLSKELSLWLDEYETPLQTKSDALALIKKVSRSSNCFRLLRRIAISIDVVDLKQEPIDDLGDLDKICTVCLEDFASETVLPCSHSFHEDCIRMWLQKQSNCPMCRFELDGDHVEGIRRRPISVLRC